MIELTYAQNQYMFESVLKVKEFVRLYVVSQDPM